MSQTPLQGSRVRQGLPEVPAASPYSSVLARLPELSPPRNKYTTSFGSLNPLASPQPGGTTSFGFRPSNQTPGGPGDGKGVVAAFDLLAGTPMKSQPADQLSSPRFELQSPKFPLFQPSPKKPLHALRSSPSVRLGDSTTAGLRGGGSFSSPFGSLLDGSSRSAPSPADATAAAAAGGEGQAARARPSGQPHPRQQRFAALFAQAGSTLDAAAAAAAAQGSVGDMPATAGGHPSYLSPLRQNGGVGGGAVGPRHASSLGTGGSGAGQLPPLGAAAAQGRQQVGRGQPESGDGAAVAAAAAAALGEGSVPAAVADDEGMAGMAGMLPGSEGEEEEEGEEDDGDDAEGEDGDEDYSAGSFRRPPPRQRGASRAAGDAQQQLFLPSQRPMRRRMLQFAAAAAAAGTDDEIEPAQLVHSTLPQSPMCQRVRMDVDMMLPIHKLRDPSGGSDDGSGSPAHRLRTGGYSLNSPAVQAAAHAAVAAALEASAGMGGGGGGGAAGSRRPVRAASAGAAAAAKAAAEAAGTPVQRRASGGSGHLALACGSGGYAASASLGSALPPLTPGEEGLEAAAPQAAFAGPKKCNCKKSKCLKLYCDCFANGGFCGPSCSCVNCANKVENSELVRVQRESIKQRNPNAFVQKIEADSTLGGQHRRGCNCKKSHCMKKYCECFQAGVPCGEHCKCDSCHNTAGHVARRPPGGGASKRARSSTAAAAHQTRQPSTRLAATSSAALSHQLKAVQAAAATQLQAAMAQASAGMAATNPATSGALEWGGPAASAKQQQQQQQQQHQAMMFPLMQPGLLSAADGSTPLMIPITMQQQQHQQHQHQHQPGGGAASSTAVPALVAFAAAAGSGQQQAAAGAGPGHVTPVAALLGPAAAVGAAGGGDSGLPMTDTFSFRPASADGGSSSGHSTPRAASAAAAAATAAADFAFALDTPAGAAAAGTASMLERLLPAADAGGAAVAAAAGTGRISARVTPTKRKPARTMTAALM